MLEITHFETYGWDGAMRGMRNSRQSWEKSDTGHCGTDFLGRTVWVVGDNDLQLATILAAKGGSHAKFRRMIHVQMDILAPLYWWKEFDTYKVGTVANSTSTMYSIMNKQFDISDFSIAEYSSAQAGMHMISTINVLNELRDLYLQEDRKEFKKMYWQDVIGILPSSYNQLRTVDMNYEVIANIYNQRKNHKLKEWRTFCKIMIEKCPYSNELILPLFCTTVAQEE
ncbi:MAG: hypothetical protein J6Y20_05640 [Lachnospiraceae bacterium]|nr:hypothetical protein [Lachnospiraceae bacterium]